MTKSDWMPMDPTTPFWKSVTPEEWHELFETSRLTGETLMRYLRMNDWQGPPPAWIEIQVNRRDILRLVRELKKQRGIK